jgi:hypothetical protein
MTTLRMGFLLSLAIGVSATASPAIAEPPAVEDWLVRELKTSVIETGPIGWDGYAAGTVVSTRTDQAGFGNSEMRTTLVKRDPDGPVFRYETKSAGRAWGKGAERKLPRGPVEGAERKVEDLGKETVSVGGKSVECAKERWTRVVKGTPSKPEIVVWTGPEHALVQWQRDLGDGWTSTFTALRDDVEWRLGDRAFRCREIREVAVAATMPMTFDRTGLWCREVPDHVVRLVTKGSMGGGGPPQSQEAELTMFAAAAEPPAVPATEPKGPADPKPPTK